MKWGKNMKNKKFFNLADITPKEALKVLKECKDGFPPHNELLLNKKLLRKIAVKVVKTMYLQIEGWEPKATRIKDDIKFVEEDIIEILKK